MSKDHKDNQIKLKGKTHFRFVLWQYLIFLAWIILWSIIFRRWVEGASFICAHYFYKYKFKFFYKSKTNWLELIFFALWCAIPRELTLSYWLLSTIFDSFMISWIASSLQEKITLTIEYKEKRLSDINKPFNVDTCSREELLIRCKELHFSKDNTDSAIAFFIDKTKQSVIADELCINEKSVAQHKFRLKKRLNDTLDNNLS